MKPNLNNRRILTLLLLLGLLLGGALVGVLAFDGMPALAQAFDDDAGEMDEDGADEDAAEGADEPITGAALEQASAAALAYLGEGRVTDTEVGDEEGYYEVEVTLENGREVDVHLDEAFNVLGREDE